MNKPVLKSTNVGERSGEAGQAASVLPLAVDLDGTLLLTDTLMEAIADRLRARPLWTLWQLAQLPFAIARVKRRLQTTAQLDIETLPVNQAVLDYCREAKAQGRHLCLASAADQSVVEAIAKRFQLFDSIAASDGKTNNKANAKAHRLAALFPQGFEYLGDSPADRQVWAAAKVASVVGGGASRARAIAKAGVPVARTFERPKAGLEAWRKAMRLHQWAKNALIFVAPTLATQISHPQVLLHCIAAFPLLGLLASGTYLLNDLLDLAADRRHHSKRARPFASGQLKLWQGFVASLGLISLSIIAGALLSPPFAVTMITYLVVTLAYSFRLKSVPLLDALMLGFLYTLRIIIGGVIADVAVTRWLLVFSMFLFVSLSLAKRHVELVRKAAQGEQTIANRGYRTTDAPLTLGLGLATAMTCPVILILYLIDSAWPSGLYSAPDWLWIAPAALSIWLMRVWLLANRAELDDDPVTFAIEDPISLGLGAVLVAAFVIAVAGLPAWLQHLRIGN